METINDLATTYIETRSDRDMTKLVNRIRPGLTNYVFNMLKDGDTADDVVADALVKMWLKIDTYDPHWSFSTWAYRIARNETMQFLRKNKPTVSLDTYMKFSGEEEAVELMHADLIAQPEEIDPIMTQDDINDALYESVMAQMEKLPAHYKDIIIDREVHEMQYEQIADKYGLQINTVKTRIIRAREKIMQMANLGERKSKAKTRKKREALQAVEETSVTS